MLSASNAVATASRHAIDNNLDDKEGIENNMLRTIKKLGYDRPITIWIIFFIFLQNAQYLLHIVLSTK